MIRNVRVARGRMVDNILATGFRVYRMRYEIGRHLQSDATITSSVREGNAA